MPIQDFKQAADTPEKLDKFGGTPYYICGHIAILEMLKAEKYVLNSKELMAFIFDRQQQFETEMKRVHASLETTQCEYHSQVGTIRFKDKKEHIPLQVADTLVYESRKYLERKIASPTIGPRPEMQRLMNKGKIFQITLCEKNSLDWYLEHSDGLT